MNDDSAFMEYPLRNESAADSARSPAHECRADPTVDDLVRSAQQGWRRFRDAELYVLAAGAPLLHFAEAHEKVFREYCACVLGDSPRTVIDPARASLEALAFALQVGKDPEAHQLTRGQRAEYASGLGWFAHLCLETEPEKAVALARSLGRLTGIAALYRKHKDAEDPSRQRRVAKARKTRSGNAVENDASTTSSEASATLPIDETQARPLEMTLSVKADTVSEPAILGSAASPSAAKNVVDQPETAPSPTEEVELPFAVRNAAMLARAGLCKLSSPGC